MTEGQIFFRPARPNSVNKHFIIWPPRFSFFPFFFYFIIFFRVTKFGMLLILTEKSGFIQQQSCFSSLLARAIDKIPVWGPYAILAGPDGFFRTCSRHQVRPSYGYFLNSFAMKARAGPYGSYNKTPFCNVKRKKQPKITSPITDRWTPLTMSSRLFSYYKGFQNKSAKHKFCCLLPQSSLPTFYVKFHLSCYCHYVINI